MNVGAAELDAALAAESNDVVWRDGVFGDRVATVTEWTTASVARFAKTAGVPAPVGGWPISQLETFWWQNALEFECARRIFTKAEASRALRGQGAPPGTGMAFDLMHLSDACVYASVYVTDDKKVRAIAREASVPCQVMTFDQWVKVIT